MRAAFAPHYNSLNNTQNILYNIDQTVGWGGVGWGAAESASDLLIDLLILYALVCARPRSCSYYCHLGLGHI